MKNSGIPLKMLPPRVQAMVLAQQAKENAPPESVQTEKKLRQNSKKLNKTEQRYLEYLQQKMPTTKIRCQEITLLIGNGVRYTPDFAFNAGVNGWQMHETKGFMRDDAAVKIKVAASQYPEFHFRLVWWDKVTYDWKFQDILS